MIEEALVPGCGGFGSGAACAAAIAHVAPPGATTCRGGRCYRCAAVRACDLGIGIAGRRGSPAAAPAGTPGGSGFGNIEVEIEGVSVRVGRGADAKTVLVVIRALKAGT